MSSLTFEKIPFALERVLRNQERIIDSMNNLQERVGSLETPIDDWFPIDIQEAAKITNNAVGTIYNKVSKKVIPHYKQGGKIYFFRDELLQWLKTGKVESNRELAENRKERVRSLFK